MTNKRIFRVLAAYDLASTDHRPNGAIVPARLLKEVLDSHFDKLKDGYVEFGFDDIDIVLSIIDLWWDVIVKHTKVPLVYLEPAVTIQPGQDGNTIFVIEPSGDLRAVLTGDRIAYGGTVDDYLFMALSTEHLVRMVIQEALDEYIRRSKEKKEKQNG